MPTEKKHTSLSCCMRTALDVRFNDHVCTFSFPRKDRVIYAVSDMGDNNITLISLVGGDKITISHEEFQETFIYIGKNYSIEPQLTRTI